MRYEVSEDGLSAINDKLADIEKQLTNGVSNPDAALDEIRNARAELFRLRTLITSEITLSPDVA